MGGSARASAFGTAALRLLIALAGVIPTAAVHAQRAEKPAAAAPAGETIDAEWRRLTNAAGEAHANRQLDEAASLAEQALHRAESVYGADHLHTLRSVNDLAVIRLALGRTDEAERLYLRLVDGRARQLGPDDPGTLRARTDLAGVIAGQGRYAEAEQLHQAVLDTRLRLLGPEHRDSLASMAEVGRLQHSRGRYAEAERMLRRAFEARARLLGPDDADTLYSANALAGLLNSLGRFAEAEPLYLRAVEASERRFGVENPSTIVFLANLAAVYRQQERYGEADPLYLRALEASERAFGPEHPSTFQIASHLAMSYSLQRRYDEAEPLYRRSLAGLERTLGPDHPRTLDALASLGGLLQFQQRQTEAEPMLRRALETSERVRGREHPSTIASITSLATMYALQGRIADAEPLMLRSLDARRRLLGEEHPDTVSTAADLALLRLRNADRAPDALEPARLVAAAMRARRAAMDEQAAAQAQARREQRSRATLFTLIADAAWAEGERGGTGRDDSLAAEAFAALQDAAAGTTDQAVARMAVRRVADREAAGLGALVREREGLEEQWQLNAASYSAALGAAGPDAEASKTELRAERVGLAERMDAIDAILRRDFPEYFSLVRPEPLDLAAVREVLAADEALLIVVPTEFGTHVMAVSREEIAWARSEWDNRRIGAAVRRLLWDVGGAVEASAEQAAEWIAEAGPGYAFDRGTAFALYGQVAAPVASALRGKRHVFVAAAGPLSSLPFGMLVTEAPQGEDGDPAALRATHWFADAHALVQIPSVQSLQLLRRFAEPAGERGPSGFIGFGDPVLLGAGQERGGGRGGAAAARSGSALVSLRQLRSLARLPGTAEELRSMRAALGAPEEALFLADRATERTLRTMDLSGARILALATHGLLAGELRGAAEPGLVFTPPDEPSEADDGYLTASEIAALRLDADWVILSACNTAAGDGSEGAPGLSGLARAFFYAGARTLLASHWPVRDDVSARLTVRTIEIQRERPSLSRAEAFQRAMREIREDRSQDGPDDTWAHPNAWAPFILIGDGAR